MNSLRSYRGLLTTIGVITADTWSLDYSEYRFSKKGSADFGPFSSFNVILGVEFMRSGPLSSIAKKSKREPSPFGALCSLTHYY